MGMGRAAPVTSSCGCCWVSYSFPSIREGDGHGKLLSNAVVTGCAPQKSGMC